MLNSTTTPKNRLANRRPTKVTNLELHTNSLLHHVVTASDSTSIPCWTPMLEEMDANLRSIKEFFLPLGGHNFDVRDMYGRTMLHKAAREGYESVVEYLVLHGANIYAQDDEGISPLGVANRFNNHNLIKLMLGKRQKEILATPFEEEKEEMKKKLDGVKLAFALLNVGIEICQALLSQEATLYRRLGVALAFICLMLSVFEMVYEEKRDQVEWKKRRRFYWFYHPGRSFRAFGNFMLWFGLVSSVLQLCLSLVTLKIKKAVLKFDYVGLLLSVFYLMARFGCQETTMRGVVRCGEHGDIEIEGRIEHGRWVFECIHCRMGKLV